MSSLDNPFTFRPPAPPPEVCVCRLVAALMVLIGLGLLLLGPD